MRDIEDILTATTEHGEEADLEMEIGDLQGIVRAIHEIMKPGERAALFASPEVAAIFEVTESDVPADGADVEAIIKCAEAHGGYDDPDHEAGDLQDAIRVGWSLLGADGRAVILEHEALSQFVGKQASPSP